MLDPCDVVSSVRGYLVSSGRSCDGDLLPLPAPVNAVGSAVSVILLDVLLSVAVGVSTRFPRFCPLLWIISSTSLSSSFVFTYVSQGICRLSCDWNMTVP